MRLCRDCRWFEPSATFADNQHDYAKCGHGVTRVFSLVTGTMVEKREQPYSYCEGLRGTMDSKACGPDARFFEPVLESVVAIRPPIRDIPQLPMETVP